MPDADSAAWERTLLELERSLAAVLAGDEDAYDWAPPALPGPIPPELIGRARALVAEQRSVIADLREAQVTVGRHLAAVQAVPNRVSHAPSAYLDVTG